MNWWDWVILISGCIAAAGTIAGLAWSWWNTEETGAHINVRTSKERTIVLFSAAGSKALHMPVVEVRVPGNIPLTTPEDHRILTAEGEPITLTIPTGSGPPIYELTAAIQWTEYGKRTPKLRGLFYSVHEHQMWSLDSKGGWKPWNRRQIQKYQARYSQM